MKNYCKYCSSALRYELFERREPFRRSGRVRTCPTCDAPGRVPPTVRELAPTRGRDA